MSVAALLSEDDLRALVAQVWQTLLTDPPAPVADPPDESGWTRAEVTISGDWSGTVRVSCPPSAARHLAAAMLDLEAGTAADEDEVNDAMGELANVIGGNIKGCLGGGTLGLPTVTADAPSVTEPALLRCGLVWRGEPLVLELVSADFVTTS